MRAVRQILFLLLGMPLAAYAANSQSEKSGLWSTLADTDGPIKHCSVQSEVGDRSLSLYGSSNRPGTLSLSIKNFSWHVPDGNVQVRLRFVSGEKFTFYGSQENGRFGADISPSSVRSFVHYFTADLSAVIELESLKEHSWTLDLHGTTPAIAGLGACVDATQILSPTPFRPPVAEHLGTETSISSKFDDETVVTTQDDRISPTPEQGQTQAQSLRELQEEATKRETNDDQKQAIYNRLSEENAKALEKHLFAGYQTMTRQGIMFVSVEDDLNTLRALTLLSGSAAAPPAPFQVDYLDRRQNLGRVTKEDDLYYVMKLKAGGTEIDIRGKAKGGLGGQPCSYNVSFHYLFSDNERNYSCDTFAGKLGLGGVREQIEQAVRKLLAPTDFTR